MLTFATIFMLTHEKCGKGRGAVGHILYLIYAILCLHHTTPTPHLIWLLLFLASCANRLCHHTLAFYNINFHLFSFVFLDVIIFFYFFFATYFFFLVSIVVVSACNALM